jgi:hypothetical protein
MGGQAGRRSLVSGSELYEAWLRRWSAAGDPSEALAKVREEVETAFRERPPPLEVRVAALESYGVMLAEFILSSLYLDEVRVLPPHVVVMRSMEALEFIRLAALAQAIELDRLANEGEGK